MELVSPRSSSVQSAKYVHYCTPLEPHCLGKRLPAVFLSIGPRGLPTCVCLAPELDPWLCLEMVSTGSRRAHVNNSRGRHGRGMITDAKTLGVHPLKSINKAGVQFILWWLLVVCGVATLYSFASDFVLLIALINRLSTYRGPF